MNEKDFKNYLASRLNETDIDEIERAAQNEYDALPSVRANANAADESAYLEVLSRVKAGPVQPGDEIK